MLGKNLDQWNTNIFLVKSVRSQDTFLLHLLYSLNLNEKQTNKMLQQKPKLFTNLPL